MSTSLKDLGFVIDRNLTCSERFSTITKNVNYSLRNNAFIKKCIDDDSVKKLVHIINSMTTMLICLYYNLPT